MRKKEILSVASIALLLAACGRQGDNAADTKTEERSMMAIESEVDESNCCICGSNTHSLMPYYRKMDSVGLVCLNTMSISNTGVRTYDDNGDEVLDGSSSGFLVNSHGEGECRFSIYGMPERGIATVDITYGENSVPDWDKIKQFLCQSCLDKVIKMYGEEMDFSQPAGRFP